MKRGLYGLLLFIIFLVLGCGSNGKPSSFNPSNKNPYFVSDNNVSVPLNKLKSFHFKVVAKDATNVKYYITGKKAKNFSIEILTGELSFQNPNDINTISVHTFTVIAEDEVSHREPQELTVNIIENELIAGNQAPLVNAGENRSTTINQSITLQGSASDGDGSIVAYQWQEGNTILANSAKFDFLPTVIGSHTLTLTVTDDDGATVSANITIIATEETSKSETLSKGLIAYYKFEGNAKDSSGNGIDGVEHGAVSYSDGLIGQAGSFDGVDDYITSNLDLPTGNSPRSVSAWFLTTSSTGNRGWNHDTILSWGTPTLYNLFAISLYKGELKVGNFGGDINTSMFPNDGMWHNIIVTYDSSIIKIFLDSKKLFSIANNYNTKSSALYIGARANERNQFMNGLIDELRIYNRPLDETEILELYKMKNP